MELLVGLILVVFLLFPTAWQLVAWLSALAKAAAGAWKTCRQRPEPRKSRPGWPRTG